MQREAAARAIEAFLRALGRDPEREPELAGTGERVARAWADELLAGYAVDADALLAENVLAGTSELVVVRDLPVATMCPHHLLPSTGAATVAFAPGIVPSASGPSRGWSTRSRGGCRSRSSSVSRSSARSRSTCGRGGSPAASSCRTRAWSRAASGRTEPAWRPSRRAGTRATSR